MKIKGFTLIEIVVVLVIVGVLAAIAIPNYNNYILQGYFQNAKNNMLAIYHAQNNYYLNNGVYCADNNSCSGHLCCGNFTFINQDLSLNMSDSFFGVNYVCVGHGTQNLQRSIGFVCTAAEPQLFSKYQIQMSDAPLGSNNPVCSGGPYPSTGGPC